MRAFARSIALFVAAFALPLAAQTSKDLGPAAATRPTVVASAPAKVAGPPAPAPAPAATAPALTKMDVDAWLDGFIPSALDQNDVAGGVVVVVKDGQVLTQRGFGFADVKTRKPVDPATTMFRAGSVSKLFTWTAVMQLVQAGKIDLDADVNRYLDFKIPPRDGKPITMRNLMTHTPGFEESAKYLLVYDPKLLFPLDKFLKTSIPARIYAPGSMPAYSNYGATLAGYIVSRVSGEPFDDYIQRHIFSAIGMAHSTFVQPLPATLAPDMASGYVQASVPPVRFELVNPAPAGALSTSGADMAKFMIAHLSSGGVLLAPQTAALMHAPANTPIPGLPSMALGFYHEDRNGLNIIGHGGDTNVFHSDLHLLLDKGVGVFMSFNSLGKDGSVHTVRTKLFDGFIDRYFPAAQVDVPTASTAHADGLAIAGHYVSSRASETNWLRALNLVGGTTVALNPDDTITVAALLNPAGVPRQWREVGRWQWQEVGGSERLGAAIRDGRVAFFAPAAFAPIIEFVRAPADMNVGWIGPLAVAAMLVLVVAALSWPVVALVRRGYAFNPGLEWRDVRLYRATRVTAWLFVAIALGWVVLVSIVSADVSALDGRLDGAMRGLQLLLVLAVVGTAFAIWNAWTVNTRRGRHRVSSVWSIVVALSAAFLVWLALDVNLLTATLNY